MKHIHYTDISEEIPKEDGVKDTTIRWLITKKDGAKIFTIRLFEMQPGGYTPLHQHDWEHEVFIVKGSGELRDKKHTYSLKQGDVIFVKPMEWHQFANTGIDILQFICAIPYK
jgi:quercetin dioxygenase-like cupin family protein